MTNRTIATVPTWRGPINVTVRHIVAAVAVLALIGGTLAVWRLATTGNDNTVLAANIPLNSEIEERFGIRFDFMAVVAKGGMIDLRYRVLDVGKAKNFGHYTETSPMLIAEDSGEVVDVTIMGQHNHRVEPGRIYSILFRNTANRIKPGRPITISIGDLKIEHAVSW